MSANNATAGPLFLVEVEKFIQNSDLDSALELCKAGIKQYPLYKTAYKRLDLINSLINERVATSSEKEESTESAVTELISGAAVIGTIPGIEYLADELPRTEDEIISTSLMKELPEMSLEGLISHSAFKHELLAQNQDLPSDEFNLLAGKISKMSFEPIEHFDSDNQSGEVSEGSNLVTETMANIYVMQGAYAQAIRAFESLAERYPFKADIYNQKIAELEADMNAAL